VYFAFVSDEVIVSETTGSKTMIEIHAFGERIAYKNSNANMRTARLVPFVVPPAVPLLLAIVGAGGFVVLVGWAARRGAFVVVLARPARAGVAAGLVALLVLGPAPLAFAGGGGNPATYYWELADRLGTGMVMLDDTGARVVHRTYTPFGAEHASAGPGAWAPRHYAGHRKDEEVGLVYMQARWMDPQSGTFVSIDPVVPAAGDPQSYNAYAYARNNPVNVTDPTGKCGVGPLGIASWGCMDPQVAEALGLTKGYFNASSAFSRFENEAQRDWVVNTAREMRDSKLASQGRNQYADAGSQSEGTQYADAGGAGPAVADELDPDSKAAKIWADDKMQAAANSAMSKSHSRLTPGDGTLGTGFRPDGTLTETHGAMARGAERIPGSILGERSARGLAGIGRSLARWTRVGHLYAPGVIEGGMAASRNAGGVPDYTMSGRGGELVTEVGFAPVVLP
jgi:RHS repeat-associated protein